MPRVTLIKKAYKPNPVVTQEDIDRAKAGEEGAASYYKWSFNFGPTCYSKTYPRASQLTRSEYYSAVYALQEEISDAGPYEDPNDLESDRDGWAEQAREIGEGCKERREEMPEGLQQGETGEMLEQRGDSMEEWAGEIEGVDVDEGPEDEDDTVEDYLRERHEEIQGVEPNVE